MNPLKFALAAILSLWALLNAAKAQDDRQPSQGAQAPTITIRSNLVLVPTLVKDKAGKVISSLSADDFILTDDGVPQPVQLETGTLSQPLALAVIVQTGGLGASHLPDYRHLG